MEAFFFLKMVREDFLVMMAALKGLARLRLSGDGVHPNDAGTEQYAKLVHDAVAEALAK